MLIPFSVLTIPGAAFPAMGTVVLPLEVRFTINGTPLSADALFELVAGANPSDAADQWYLSQDLRVFQTGPGAPSTPFVSWPASGSGYDYMKSLLLYLNDQSPRLHRRFGRPLHRFATERATSTDTTAAGGNATLLS